MPSAAEATREALRARPVLHEALRAGVLNYSAAADRLDVDADPETVAAALRRYAADLPERTPRDRSVRVTVRRNVGVAGTADDGVTGTGDAEPLLRVGGVTVTEGGEATAFVGTGDVDAAALAVAIARLETAGTTVVAAGVADDRLVAVVDGGTRHLAAFEEALADAPGVEL